MRSRTDIPLAAAHRSFGLGLWSRDMKRSTALSAVRPIRRGLARCINEGPVGRNKAIARLRLGRLQSLALPSEHSSRLVIDAGRSP